MSPAKRMRRVILPQAVLIMLPAWGNLLIELLKGTALVALIAVADLMFQVKQINGTTFLSAEAFGTALIIYYILARFHDHALHALARTLHAAQAGEGLSRARLALGLHLGDPAPPPRGHRQHAAGGRVRLCHRGRARASSSRLRSARPRAC
jgi:hypothetical protein